MCSSITGTYHELDKWKKLLEHDNHESCLLVAMTSFSSQEAVSEMQRVWFFINPSGPHGDADVTTFTQIPENICYSSRWDHAALFLCGNTMSRMKGNTSILCGKTTSLHKVIHGGISIIGSKSPPVFAACKHFSIEAMEVHHHQSAKYGSTKSSVAKIQSMMSQECFMVFCK